MPSRLLILAAAVLWSTGGVLLKAPAFESLPAAEQAPVVAGLRALCATLVLLPFVLKSQESRRRMRWRFGLLPMAGSFAAMSVLFVAATLATTAAAAIFLQFTSVGWACLLGWLVLGERPGKADAVAVACVLAGIGVIVAGDAGRGTLIGSLLALASGLALAGVIVSLRALRDEDPAWLTLVNHAAAAAVALPWLALPLLMGRPMSLTGTQLGLVAALGVVQMALPYLLFSAGLKHVPAREASLLTLVEPILNPVWVLLVWGETVPAATWAGGGIILCGLVLRFALVERRRPIVVPAAARTAVMSER